MPQTIAKFSDFAQRIAQSAAPVILIGERRAIPESGAKSAVKTSREAEVPSGRTRLCAFFPSVVAGGWKNDDGSTTSLQTLVLACRPGQSNQTQTV